MTDLDPENMQVSLVAMLLIELLCAATSPEVMNSKQREDNNYDWYI